MRFSPYTVILLSILLFYSCSTPDASKEKIDVKGDVMYGGIFEWKNQDQEF